MKTKSVVAGIVLALGFFIAGIVTGFFLGVWSTEVGSDFLEDLASEEEPADVDHPKKIVREGFRLEYPGNWQIDTADADYDPDHLFSIDSPGSVFVMFIMIDLPTDPSDNVEEQVGQFSKLIAHPVKSPFQRWGVFSGEGVLLKGRILGMKAGVRIFSHSAEDKSFIVVHQYFDEDLTDVEPGFKLIERTFQLIE